MAAPQYGKANVCPSPYKTTYDFLHLMMDCWGGIIPNSPSDERKHNLLPYLNISYSGLDGDAPSFMRSVLIWNF